MVGVNKGLRLYYQLSPRKANVVDDALSRKEKLKMIISSEELIEEFERLELGVRISGEGNEGLFEIRVEPELVQKIKRCQQQIWEEERVPSRGKNENVSKTKKDY